jgi:MFS family permease
MGIGIGLIYIPSLGIIAHHFKRRRSLALGIVAAGTSLGGIVHPIMLNQLIHGRIGFAWGVRISAFFNLVLLVLGNVLMTTRLPVRREKGGLRGRLRYWVEVFTDLPFLLSCLGSMFFSAGGFFPIFFLQLEAVRKGVSSTLAFYAVSSFLTSRIITNIEHEPLHNLRSQS